MLQGERSRSGAQKIADLEAHIEDGLTARVRAHFRIIVAESDEAREREREHVCELGKQANFAAHAARAREPLIARLGEPVNGARAFAFEWGLGALAIFFSRAVREPRSCSRFRFRGVKIYLLPFIICTGKITFADYCLRRRHGYFFHTRARRRFFFGNTENGATCQWKD